MYGEKLEEFAELNDYDMEEARSVVESMHETTENPGLKAWSEELLGGSE